MSSHLQSFDGPSAILPELTKLIDETKDSSHTLENLLFAKLGQKYLSAIVANILMFRIKTPVKDVDALLEANISNYIDSKYFKGQSREKLQIGIGRTFHEKDMDKIKRVESDIQNFFQLEFSNKQSYSKFIFEVSISAIDKKLAFSNIFDDSCQLQPYSEINSSNKNDKSFDKILKNLDIEKHIIEVEKYLKDKNGTTELNLLKDYKQKTITVENDLLVVGAMTRHTVKLEFVNFIEDSQKVYLLATKEGSNKNVARQKASKLMLTKFFSTYPFVFKDYLHCMKIKGK